MSLIIFGEVEDKTREQAEHVAKTAKHVALMADNHFGYVAPVGSVAAYENQVSVNGIGYDIGCGNCAIKLDTKIESIAPHLSELADTIAAELDFGVGRKNRNSDDFLQEHALFHGDAWDAIPDSHREKLRVKAVEQLGTIGGGNHYVDVFSDSPMGAVWIGVHFGSRGLGHTIASGFFAEAAGLPWGAKFPESEVILDLDTEQGQRYWALKELASEYAMIGREWVAYKVGRLVDSAAGINFYVNNHHNDAWREAHDLQNGDGPREYIVVRKGATPAFPGQYGFVGGSMGDPSVILRGAALPSQAQRDALYSTVHGAGRVLGRMAAKGKPARPGAVSRKMMDDWMQDIELRGGDVDEAPQCYKRLHKVLEAQGETIEITTVLTPRIVVMAGANVNDPFRD